MNEPALCPVCNTHNYIKEQTFGSHVLRGHCNNCTYQVKRVEPAKKDVTSSPPTTPSLLTWQERSKENLARLAKRGVKKPI